MHLEWHSCVFIYIYNAYVCDFFVVSSHFVILQTLNISSNEVFGDIMVLALPAHTPVDPHNENTLARKHCTYIFFKIDMYIPLLPRGTLLWKLIMVLSEN